MQAVVPVIEAYKDWTPPFDVRSRVLMMLDSVASNRLMGLRSIVLTNLHAVAAPKRKGRIRSRGRKVEVSSCLGFYYPGHKGELPWIELLVDRICAQYPSLLPTVLLRMPLLQDILVSDTLFHELGHHIHRTKVPEFADKEQVAEAWSRRLLKAYMRSRHSYIVPVAYCLKPLVTLVRVLKRMKVGRKPAASTG